MYSIAIFGGTFDPIHNGHIQTSLVIQEAFHFDSYRFIPCKLPTIKPPSEATTAQRVYMLELAIKNYKQFEIDLREINRTTPSYMVETLQGLRDEYKHAAITLILGYDAFLTLPKWHHWQELIKLANLLIINRDSFNLKLSESLQSFQEQHLVKNKEVILNHHAGTIYQFNAGNYPISSTQIKTQLRENLDVSNQIPRDVYQYIKTHKLYLSERSCNPGD